MKNLDKILEYQDLDIKLRRVLDVIEKSDDYKKIETAKSEFTVAKKTVEESEKAAASLVEFFKSSQRYYEEISKKIDEVESVIENNTQEDLDVLTMQLNKLKSKLSELELKTAERRKKAETVVKAYSAANERGRKIREIHAKAKERQDVLYKSKEPEINQLKAKLSSLEPLIDKDILKQYKTITAEKKYPAFVEVYVDGKTYSCKGCGIALSQSNSSFLEDKGYCLCETCRRYIYKK